MKADEYLRCARCQKPYQTGKGDDGTLVAIPDCTHATPALLTDDGWALVVLPAEWPERNRRKP